jgi:hydrogenase maturation factor HypF (carbamoyltransferase family)
MGIFIRHYIGDLSNDIFYDIAKNMVKQIIKKNDMDVFLNRCDGIPPNYISNHVKCLLRDSINNVSPWYMPLN